MKTVLKASIAFILAVLLLGGCDYMGDKKDEVMEEKRHAQEIREALQYEKEMEKKREANREMKLRLAEEARQAEIEKARMLVEERQREREEKRKAEELRRMAEKKKRQYNEYKSHFTRGRITWWEDAPKAEYRIRGGTNATYLCAMNHTGDGSIFFLLETNCGKIEKATRLGEEEDIEVPREGYMEMSRGKTVLASRLMGTSVGNEIYVWNGKSHEDSKQVLPGEYDTFNPSKEELGGLYESIGTARGRSPKRKYRIYLHIPGKAVPEPVCDVGFGEEIGRDVFQDYMYARLFEQKEAEYVSRNKPRSTAKKKRIPDDSPMRSFRTVTNVSGPASAYRPKVERWDRVGAARERIEKTAVNYGSPVSVSNSDVEKALMNCKMSYRIVK